MLDSEKVNCFLRMQLRMLEIRNEVEMLEIPGIRKTYEEVHFKAKSINDEADQKPNIYVVTMTDTINKQMEYFDAVKSVIGADEIIQCAPSLTVRPNKCASSLEFTFSIRIPRFAGLFEKV